MKPCYDKWWEWSHCIECAMCCGEDACEYHEEYGEEEKDLAVEGVKKRLKPAETLIRTLNEKHDVPKDYLEAVIYKIIMENINPK